MRFRHRCLLVLCLAWLGLTPLAHAQQAGDAAYNAAARILRKGAEADPDANYSIILLALRRLEEPALLPYFTALSRSPAASVRVHGHLGMMQLSPKKELDLAALAEIKDEVELVSVLSAAIDDGFIGPAQMKTLLQWEGLHLAIRQTIALRLIAEGQQVDTQPFKPALQIELDDEQPVNVLLQHALAGLLLAESGDPAGVAALDKLKAWHGPKADLVINQVLDGAMRHGFKSAGPLALAVAKDAANRDPGMGFLPLHAALRLGQPGAGQLWQATYAGAADEPAQQTRLALIALDQASHCPDAVFDTLSRSSTQWLVHMAQAGRAVKGGGDLAAAFAPLIADAQPISTEWVVSYCRRDKPAQGPDLLEPVIRSHALGDARTQPKLSMAAVRAVSALCTLYPKQANERLTRILNETAEPADDTMLGLRQVVCMGIYEANDADTEALTLAIGPDTYNNFTLQALRLLLRTGHGAPLTDAQWARVGDIVQGAGSLALSMRAQLAWSYLVHTGQADRAIHEATR